MLWARASMKGRTEHKESIWLWAIIVYSLLEEWLLLVPAAFCNPEDNPRLGWEGGESQCTSFCPFVGAHWAKDKKSTCNRGYMEAEGAELSSVGLAVIHFTAGELQSLSWCELLHTWLAQVHIYTDSCAIQQQTHLSYSDICTEHYSSSWFHLPCLKVHRQKWKGEWKRMSFFPSDFYHFNSLPPAVPVYLKT